MRVLLSAFICILMLADVQESFPVRGKPGFGDPQPLLQQLVQQKGRVSQNHFCIIGYRDASGYTNAWVYWSEEDAIILWTPSRGTPEPLSDSRRYLDLKKDVVATDADVGTSTYVVSRTWVERVKSECAEKGDKYVILRRPSGKQRPQPRKEFR